MNKKFNFKILNLLALALFANSNVVMATEEGSGPNSNLNPNAKPFLPSAAAEVARKEEAEAAAEVADDFLRTHFVSLNPDDTLPENEASFKDKIDFILSHKVEKKDQEEDAVKLEDNQQKLLSQVFNNEDPCIEKQIAVLAAKVSMASINEEVLRNLKQELDGLKNSVNSLVDGMDDKKTSYNEALGLIQTKLTQKMPAAPKPQFWTTAKIAVTVGGGLIVAGGTVAGIVNRSKILKFFRELLKTKKQKELEKVLGQSNDKTKKTKLQKKSE